MNATGHRLLAVLTGVAVAGALVGLEVSVPLALVVGVEWGMAVALLFRIDRRRPGYFRKATAGRAWQGIGAALFTLPALVGVVPLSLPSPTGPTIAMLVLGTGLATYLAGVVTALECSSET